MDPKSLPTNPTIASTNIPGHVYLTTLDMVGLCIIFSVVRYFSGGEFTYSYHHDREPLPPFGHSAPLAAGGYFNNLSSVETEQQTAGATAFTVTLLALNQSILRFPKPCSYSGFMLRVGAYLYLFTDFRNNFDILVSFLVESPFYYSRDHLLRKDDTFPI